WSGLELAQRVTTPTPEPIAADLESAWFGRPVVVMSRLPGRADVTPKSPDLWVASLARALAPVPETVLGGATPQPSPPIQAWRPWRGRTPSADRSRRQRRRSASTFTFLGARPHARGLPSGQRSLAPRPHHWCRRLERSRTRRSLVRARVLPSRRVSAPRAGRR